MSKALFDLNPGSEVTVCGGTRSGATWCAWARRASPGLPLSGLTVLPAFFAALVLATLLVHSALIILAAVILAELFVLAALILAALFVTAFQHLEFGGDLCGW